MEAWSVVDAPCEPRFGSSEIVFSWLCMTPSNGLLLLILPGTVGVSRSLSGLVLASAAYLFDNWLLRLFRPPSFLGRIPELQNENPCLDPAVLPYRNLQMDQHAAEYLHRYVRKYPDLK